MKITFFTAVVVTVALAFTLLGCSPEGPLRVGEPPAPDETATDVAEAAAEANGDARANGERIDIASLQDGIYIAGEEFNPRADWRNIVLVEVRNGRIESVEWTAAPRTGGTDKLTRSRDGEYGMEMVAEWPWHEQAEAAAAYLVETQDPYQVDLHDDGTTDAITGATMTVSYFFELAQQALAGGPVGRGPYRDGAYYAEADEPGSDWHDAVYLTIIHGHIASVHWAPQPVDGDRDKYRYSRDGDYGMEMLSDWAWHEHVDAVARYILEHQTIDGIELDDEGRPDAITGATIVIDYFIDVAMKALAQAEG